MSEISDMIQRLCPDGVEYRKLGEVGNINRGIRVVKNDLQISGLYPVFQNSLTPLGQYNQYNYDANTAFVISAGAAGDIGFSKTRFWAADDCLVITPFDKIVSKFIFYYLMSQQPYIKSRVRKASIPRLSKDVIYNLEIPVPPLEVQRKIVEVLDNFSELTAELTAELEARKKQYEYYRDNLLNFSQIAPNSVKWMKISEVFEIRNGYTPSKAKAEFWESGTIPWFRMEDIRQNGRILSDSILHITSEGVKGKGLFKANSFILATTATIGEHALIIADSLANQQFTNLKICKSLEKELTIKYVFYYLFVVDEWCKANTNVSGFASVDMAKFKNLLFPIPPLSEQERIVSILDRFESLTTDLTSGLPAEIKARQQQYEYYRDQLLTFKRAN